MPEQKRLLSVRNWDKFQHYRHRRPPWIKLHRQLLDDCRFHALPLGSRALAPMLWLLASEEEDGVIDFDTPSIAFRLRMPEQEMLSYLIPLIEQGFFLLSGDDASTMLADCLHAASKLLHQSTETEYRDRGKTKTTYVTEVLK